MPLFGEDTSFYDLLEKQADAAVEAARQFHAGAKDFGGAAERSRAIGKIEADADGLTHELSTRADQKMITPLDKEDLQRLSNAMDDIIDAIEAAMSRIVIYRLTQPRPDFAPMTEQVLKITETVRQAVGGLRKLRHHGDMGEALVRIHQQENAFDQTYRTALGDLFADSALDPLTVIKWKEIYDRLEVATDTCETAAVILEGVMVKYG
jgi:uncharacterized protein Yka (UPF0111/DUF47 family)